MPEKNVHGHYVLENRTNTYFDFDTSGRFTYVQRNPLKPLFNKGNYVLTEGLWTFNNSGYITLNSLKRTEPFEKETVKKINKSNISSFTFYDMSLDTLPIVGATHNGQWFGRVHNLMKSFELNLSKSDTVTADLIGYDKFKFTNTDTSQFAYHVVLYPEYVADFFKNRKLLLKRKRIIDIELNETYEKKKGM